MAFVLHDDQRLVNVQKDFGQGRKNTCAYIVCDRCHEWILLGQSIPALTRFINKHISDGPWSDASVTGLFENMNCEGLRNGGYHRGRYRIGKVHLESAPDVFEEEREDYVRAAIVASRRRAYETVHV